MFHDVREIIYKIKKRMGPSTVSLFLYALGKLQNGEIILLKGTARAKMIDHI